MDDLDFIDLSPEGIPRLWELLDDLRTRGRMEAAHACADLLVRCCARHHRELTRAETLARQLVDELPDRRHFLLLARVLEAQGRLAEASLARAEALGRDDLHPGPSAEEKAQSMTETLEAARAGKLDKPN